MQLLIKNNLIEPGKVLAERFDNKINSNQKVLKIKTTAGTVQWLY